MRNKYSCVNHEQLIMLWIINTEHSCYIIITIITSICIIVLFSHQIEVNPYNFWILPQNVLPILIVKQWFLPEKKYGHFYCFVIIWLLALAESGFWRKNSTQENKVTNVKRMNEKKSAAELYSAFASSL